MSEAVALVVLAACLIAAIARWRWAPDWAVAAIGAAALAGVRRPQHGRRAVGRQATRPDRRVPRRAAPARRRVPARGHVRCARRLRWRRLRRASEAVAGDGVPRRRGHDRGAKPRRDDRVADADRVRNRGEAAHQSPTARVRLLAPGQQRVAAAPGLEPDQSAGLSRQRAVVHPLQRPHGASLDRRARDRMAGPARVVRR